MFEGVECVASNVDHKLENTLPTQRVLKKQEKKNVVAHDADRLHREHYG
jgi:hypothetical protein